MSALPAPDRRRGTGVAPGPAPLSYGGRRVRPNAGSGGAGRGDDAHRSLQRSEVRTSSASADYAARALPACYRLIGELLLHPQERDAARIRRLLGEGAAGDPLFARITDFLRHPLADSADEYVQTLELAPPCPLYLGAYLFDEPTTCRGAGTSGRNGYMLDLVGVYRHFGLELSGRELPDYLPALVEFLAISLECPQRDGIGLRRWLLEQLVAPALEPLCARLATYQSPYELVAQALRTVVSEDLRRIGDAPAWRPPRLTAGYETLPVLMQADGLIATAPAAAIARSRSPE